MANILIVTRGLPSLVYPGVELARRLAAAGHCVTVAGDPDDRRLVEHHALAFLPLEPGGYEEFLKTDHSVPRLTRLMNVRRRRGLASESLGMRGFVEAVRGVRADLLLINGEMHEHIITASGAGMRVALLNSFVSIWRQPGVPPPHHVARPGTGWRGTRAGMSLLWGALRVRKWWRVWHDRCLRIGCDHTSVLRKLSREVGFDFAREIDASQWLIPFTYRRLPALTLHALEFEFPHRPPDHVRYVGPMVLESRLDRRPEPVDMARLDAVIARRFAGGGRRTLIYAAFGSVLSTDLQFLRHLVRIVAERPAWDLVISLSNGIAPSSLAPLPERVHVFSWLPQLHVLAHTDVAVTHGGINTIDECVVHGVPVLVYCGGQTDMAGTTSRVVHHGIGLAGDRRRDGPAEIRGHVDRLIEEPVFHENLRGLRRRYAAYVQDRVAERAVESLLGGLAERDRVHADQGPGRPRKTP